MSATPPSVQTSASPTPLLSNKKFHVTVGAVSALIAIALQIIPALQLPPAVNALVLGILGAINTYLHSR